MKSNYNSIVDLREDLTKLNDMKRDYVIPSTDIWFQDEAVHIKSGNTYEMNDWMMGQAADKAGIPRQYATKIRNIAPGLFEMSLNTLIRKDPEKNHLVRTYHEPDRMEARAMLTDRFGTWDNYDVMEQAILPALARIENKEIEIKVSAMTDKRMYLAFIWPSIEREIAQVGDVVRFGAFIRNGEVGGSAFAGGLYSETLSCLNGMVAQDMFRKIHISRNDGNDIFLSDSTKEKKLEAMMSETKDLIEFIASGAPVDEYVAKLDNSVSDKITKPEKVVENILKKYSIDKETGEIIIQNMSDTGNYNRYGLSNGITYAAHQEESIDRQYELERTGSKVIELTPEEWKSVAA